MMMSQNRITFVVINYITSRRYLGILSNSYSMLKYKHTKFILVNKYYILNGNVVSQFVFLTTIIINLKLSKYLKIPSH